jgi:hypothetical protein
VSALVTKVRSVTTRRLLRTPRNRSGRRAPADEARCCSFSLLSDSMGGKLESIRRPSDDAASSSHITSRREI